MRAMLHHALNSDAAVVDPILVVRSAVIVDQPLAYCFGAEEVCFRPDYQLLCYWMV